MTSGRATSVGRRGRFTSPDPENLGSILGDPQSWNMDAYGRNNQNQ